MVRSNLFSFLLTCYVVSVVAQEPQLDIAAIAEAGAPPKPSIATNVPFQTVVYDASEASAEAAAEQIEHAHDNDDTTGGSKVKRAPCDPQWLGQGPVPSPDTASAFASYSAYASAASAAPTPSGYNQAFKNLDGMNSALGYMGFTLLDTYDTNLCASKCDAIYGCNAFNIAYERSPSLDPSPEDGECPQPPTTVLIKCVFWGGPVTSANAVNRGQWRNNYEVLIAGSNGYVNQSTDVISGYAPGSYLENRAISAPNDCNDASTFIGHQYWNDGKPFDTKRCSAACSAQTQANPSSPCRFFNTYIISKENQAFGQYCALYSQAWADSFATVNSVTYNGSPYTVSYSYSYTVASYSYTCTIQPKGGCGNPGKCGSYQICAGTTSNNCRCGTDVAGVSACFLASTPCSSKSCTSNSQCAAGQICLNANSCCGASVCASINSCVNTKSKRFIFRKREDLWTADHVPDDKLEEYEALVKENEEKGLGK